jgi:hypothetical protein
LKQKDVKGRASCPALFSSPLRVQTDDLEYTDETGSVYPANGQAAGNELSTLSVQTTDTGALRAEPISSPDHAPVHPLGSEARVLLTSVFGPYAQDDEYGSRSLNPMELYHNQVTRVQGPFSLRMFHRSWGLMLIQAEHHRARARCSTSRSSDRFIEEITAQAVRHHRHHRDHARTSGRCGGCASSFASISPKPPS